jgi:hypothetical protein
MTTTCILFASAPAVVAICPNPVSKTGGNGLSRSKNCSLNIFNQNESVGELIRGYTVGVIGYALLDGLTLGFGDSSKYIHRQVVRILQGRSNTHIQKGV